MSCKLRNIFPGILVDVFLCLSVFPKLWVQSWVEDAPPTCGPFRVVLLAWRVYLAKCNLWFSEVSHLPLSRRDGEVSPSSFLQEQFQWHWLAFQVVKVIAPPMHIPSLLISCKYLSTVCSWTRLPHVCKIVFVYGVAANKIIPLTPTLPISCEFSWSGVIYLSALLFEKKTKSHLTCCSGTGGSWLNGFGSAVSPQLIGGGGGETPAWFFRVLIRWFGVMGCPVHEHANPSAAGPNTVLCVDGGDGHADRVSSRSRKWELEGSCYQAPSFLQILHGAKLKPCVFSPCGRPQHSRPGCLAG